ncbi:UNVERIFIED_CONTAM: Dynamin-related protein 4C [Sesamum indicum]
METIDPEYMDSWNKLMSYQKTLMETLNNTSKPTKIQIEGLGEVNVAHLRNHMGIAEEAFDLRMRLMAYWKIVLRRLVDSMALHLLFSIQNLVNKELEGEIVNEVVGPDGSGLERMLDESPTGAEKRKRLKNSIMLLKESKDVVSNIMDKIATYAD